MGRLGMTAAAAARCFEHKQAAAGSPSFEAAITVLAALLAAGGTAGKPGEQVLREVLTRHPSTVQLLMSDRERLQSTIGHLLQLGLSQQQFVASLHTRGWTLLTRPPEHLAELEAALQQDLGGDRQLWLKMLRLHRRAASGSVDTFRERAHALAVVR